MKGKVLITGASGFIGGALWRYLSSAAYDVVACVTSGAPSEAPRGVSHEFRMPGEDLPELVAATRPDWILHAAGSSSVPGSFRDPAKDLEQNVTVTEHVFRAVVASSIRARVLFLSSAAVYGDPAHLPVSEEDELRPVSPYGFHKLMAELVCAKYHRLERVPVGIIRPFTVYGPGLRKQLLWDIHEQTHRGDSVRLSGNGEQTRDLMYVDDFAEAVRLAMERLPFEGEAVNAATGIEISVRDLARLMLEALGTNRDIEFSGQGRPGDPLRWRADISRLQSLGLERCLTVREGIERYAGWLRSQRPEQLPRDSAG